MSEDQFVYCEIITGVPHCKCMWHLIHLLPLCTHKLLQLRYQAPHICQLKLVHIRRTEQYFPVDLIELRQIKQDHKGSFTLHETKRERDVTFIWVLRKFNVLFILSRGTDQKTFSLMVYLHYLIRIPIPILIRTANQMATLYYAELITLHGVRFGFQS